MRKTLSEQLANKTVQIHVLKQEIASLEKKAAERIGKIAVRAGLADCDWSDEALLKELQAVALRFQHIEAKLIIEKANTAKQGRTPLTEVSDDGEKAGYAP